MDRGHSNQPPVQEVVTDGSHPTAQSEESRAMSMLAKMADGLDPPCQPVAPVNVGYTSASDTSEIDLDRGHSSQSMEVPDKLGMTDEECARPQGGGLSMEEYISDSCDSDDATDPDYFVSGSSEDDSDESDSGSERSYEIPVYKPQGNNTEVTITSSTPENPEYVRPRENNTEVTSSTPETAKYIRPKRPCPFCGKFQTRLTRHITLVHKDVKEVSEAVAAPEEERLAAFSKMKKQGILNENKLQTQQNNPVFQQERKPRTSSKLVMCGNCNGFYHSRFLSRHRKRCLTESSQINVCVPLSVLSRLDENTDGFVSEVLGKMRDDTIGTTCKNDPCITLVGRRLWMKNRLKQDKKEEVRKMVMTSMRRLGSLYQAFISQQDELGPIVSDTTGGTAADMFLRNNFRHLEQAIHACTLKGEGRSLDELKHGLKTGLFYLIKKACKYLKGTYLIEDADDKAEGIDKFLHVFELSHDALFGDAAYAAQKVRNEKLRRPEILPLEIDVQKVREYTIHRTEALMADQFEVFDSHAFIELRDLIVCRLTLFNGRRGGEPCRLRLKDWTDAEQSAWVTQESIEQLEDPLDQYFANSTKVAYQTGKGNRHLVPVLLPEDTINPLRRMADQETRSLAGIASTNTYLFPSSQGSETHVSGWHAFHRVCEKVDLERAELLTATKNRHRVSTLYAVMEVPESERRFFYDHMGHSGDMNADIYQAPLALMEVLKVGRPLSQIDRGSAKPVTSTAIASEADSHSLHQESNNKDLCQIALDHATVPGQYYQSSMVHMGLYMHQDSNNASASEAGGPTASGTSCKERQAIVSEADSPGLHQESSNKDLCQDSNNASASEAGGPTASGTSFKERQGVSGASKTLKRQHTSGSDCDGNTKGKKCVKGRKYVKWSAEDADLVMEEFRMYVNGERGNRLPGQEEIEQFKRRVVDIKHDWMTIKTKINNERVKMRRIAEERRRAMNI